jgi:hypothetical protein
MCELLFSRRPYGLSAKLKRTLTDEFLRLEPQHYGGMQAYL